ncbi:MAG: GIY-YIG nuclease family protein [Fluviicola sp.]|nr:GIY-YIG nuclease family protein [Fluviicola sp.]
MKTYFIYILKCADDAYYVGFTNNVGRRFIEHMTGYNPNSYTSRRLPVVLVYAEKFHSPWVGIMREKQLKRWSRKKKEALIRGDIHELKAAAKKVFPKKVSKSDLGTI